MRKMIIALAAAGASQPQPTGQANLQRATAQNQKQKTHKVCVSYTPTGSYIAKTKCVVMTVAQYQAYKKAQKEHGKKERASFERFQDRTGPCAQGVGTAPPLKPNVTGAPSGCGGG